MIEVPKVAIIVAAGSGTRMGGLVPKQFQDLGGIPLGIHPGLQFRKFDPTIELVYVIAIGTAVLWENLLTTHFPNGGWRLCMGGKSRYESVRNGIKSIKNPETLVAIHDAARPFIEPSKIKIGFQVANDLGNATFSIPVKDSLRSLSPQGNSSFVDRSLFHFVQTPQIFWQRDLKSVYQAEDDLRFTDDATVMELAGHKIHLVEGSYSNIKVTTPDDWVIAERILERTLTTN
jgi:2-C-methyl-D-erythritol 4-phosphate cytidylyltransferase